MPVICFLSLQMIEMNETSRLGTKLVDISKEFSLLKENKGLLLSIETIKGLQLMPGNFTTLVSQTFIRSSRK